MNLKQRLLTTAAAATLLGAVSAPAAQAASFGNSGISFDQTTTVKFDFLSSQGQWKDNFGVYDVAAGQFHYLFGEDLKAFDSPANDFNGTVGTSLSNGSGLFTFAAGKQYALALDINPTNSDGSVIAGKQRYAYSTDSLNGWSSSNQNGGGYANQVKFNDGTSANPFTGPVTLGFEDNPLLWQGNPNTPWVHIDYNDFMVKAQVVSASVPEPTTLAGLGLVAGALAVSRRRKASQPTQ